LQVLYKKKNKQLLIWGSILASIILLSVFANLFCAPSQVNLQKVLYSPNLCNLLGTDSMGRDVLSMILYGGRVSLGVSIVAALIATLIGIVFGGVSGYIGGWVDNVLMRILDGLIAIPAIIIILGLRGIIGGGIYTIVILIAITGWMPTAKIMSVEFREIKQKEYVKAAYMLGSSHWQIVTTHILRNSMPSILIVTVFNCAHAVFAEVSLSYLGLGVPQHITSWGNMLVNAQNHILSGGWWIAIFPGTMIIITMLAINFLGEALKSIYRKA